MFLRRKEKTTVTSLLEKKNSILGMFITTQSELVKLKEEQNAYLNDLVEELEEIQLKVEGTKALKDDTDKMIKKIDNFLK